MSLILARSCLAYRDIGFLSRQETASTQFMTFLILRVQENEGVDATDVVSTSSKLQEVKGSYRG